MSMERADSSGEPADGTDIDTDEEEITQSITQLRIEVDRIESTTGPSKRTHCMRTEIERLESQLACCENQAKDGAGQISQDTP
jgi:uncharacterized small protein (DUF1192 family)